MKTKYVITHVNDRLISAEFSDDVTTALKCESLHVLNETGITGNMYIGRVENVVKNLNCAFVEIQKGVKCYYSLDDNKRHIFLNRKNNDTVNSGDLLLIQVSREAMKTKPATATAKLSISGRYVVLSCDVKGVTISGKTSGNIHCSQLKQLLLEHFSLSVSLTESDEKKGYGFHYGFILRTNSAGAKEEQVLEEARQLVQQYTDILRQATYGTAFQMLYQAVPSYMGELKNIRTSELTEVITDDLGIYQQISEEYFNQEDSHKQDCWLRLYEDKLLPLYKLYSLETELERALSRKVWLKSGGYLVIEQTEALTVIDVNTGKFSTKKQGDEAKESGFVKTNKEAATEIARQLKLRNLSGIIIIDFINMKQSDSNSELMTYLRRQIKSDQITTTVVDITKLGLVELTRKKSGKSLIEAWRMADE